MHPTLSAIYRPSELTILWGAGQGCGVEGWVGGDFSGKGTAVSWLAAQLYGPRPKVGE